MRKLLNRLERSDKFHGLLDNLALVLENEKIERLSNSRPASLSDLVVVIGRVAGNILHQEPRYTLVESLSLAVIIAHIPIFGLVERQDQFGVDTRFLADFPLRRLLGRLAFIDHPFRKLPSAFRFSQYDGYLQTAVHIAVCHAARGILVFSFQFFNGCHFLAAVHRLFNGLVELFADGFAESCYLFYKLSVAVEYRGLRNGGIITKNE